MIGTSLKVFSSPRRSSQSIFSPRSLVTTLRSAEKFEESHLSSEAVAPYIESAKVFYIEGYFLTHGAAAVTNLAKKASAASKVSCFLLR